MIISNIPTLYNPNFTSKPRKTNVTSIPEMPFDIASFNAKNEGNPPERIVLTELEKQYYDVLIKLERLERNIQVQKQNLRDFYSFEDKFAYKELLKERHRLNAQLKRIYQKTGVKDQFKFEIDILQKKQYNRFAAKILKAITPEGLKKILDSIPPYTLYTDVKSLLNKLISTRVFK